MRILDSIEEIIINEDEMAVGNILIRILTLLKR